MKVYYNFTQQTCIEITLYRTKPVTHVSICCLANPYNENHTHSRHFFQCPSEKPCTEEKRFPKKILDSSQLLSSSLNITQEGCEKLHRVQAQGSIVQGKERCYERIDAKIDQNRRFVARLKKSKSLFFCRLVDISKYTNAM